MRSLTLVYITLRLLLPYALAFAAGWALFSLL